VSEPAALAISEPMLVVDVRAPHDWAGDEVALWMRTGRALHGCVALIGEHVDNPVLHDDVGRLPPEHVINILRDAGVPVIATVTGRDRGPEAARRMMRRFADAGAVAIHCVTGDHPAALGIDRPAAFGCEAMTLIGLAVRQGVTAVVGESPASPGPRAQRVRAKAAAGASLCILNHAGDATELADFADRCASGSAPLEMIAPVPMVADKPAALGLATFPGLRLPTAYLDTIIDAVDPCETGLVMATEFVRALASTGRFVGVNLSGSAGGRDPWERLELTERFIDGAQRALSST
jgi:hypothetical protein